ncbi:MAG TPA: DUF1236 domain-containing protein [Bauldia sp.]|nr:DUF1236 domain-containing protein [Bauldia sp.]
MKKLMLATVAAVAISLSPALAQDVSVTIEPEVDTWVMTQDGPDVVVDGDVAVGAVLPDTVTVVEVPNHTKYGYVKVKGKKVIIDTDTRKVLKIY